MVGARYGTTRSHPLHAVASGLARPGGCEDVIVARTDHRSVSPWDHLFCLAGIEREVHSVRPTVPRLAIELPVHALCALGIVIGRVARLNSWDTIARPVGTLESVFTTLTWRGVPVAFVLVFVAVWASSTVLRVLLVAAAASSRRLARGLRPAARSTEAAAG